MSARERLPAVEVGFQVFLKDGEEEFGAVRDILADGHLVVDIENKGDVLIPLDAITDVVEQKVLRPSSTASTSGDRCWANPTAHLRHARVAGREILRRRPRATALLR
jgi:hypothetical protein